MTVPSGGSAWKAAPRCFRRARTPGRLPRGRIEARDADGGKIYHVEAYGEGLTRLNNEEHAAAQPRRLVLETRAEVKLQSYEPKGIVPLEQAPKDLALRARGFPVTAPKDDAVRPVQFSDLDMGAGAPAEDMPDEAGAIPADAGAAVNAEDLAPPAELPARPAGSAADRGPILPNTRRYFAINPRDSGPNFKIEARNAADGRVMIIMRGGVNITAEQPGQGTIDISADSAVIWTQFNQDGKQAAPAVSERQGQDPQAPFEVYLEGNVVFRQDKRQIAGTGDQKVVQCQRFYMDLRTEWFLAEQAEVDVFNPFLITPMKIHGAVVRQFRPSLGVVNGKMTYGPAQIHADEALLTGSRFPVPGYRFQSRSVDLTQIVTPLVGPNGKPLGNPKDPNSPQASSWRVEALGNVFKLGAMPLFYWPRIVTDTDDLDPPLRQIAFRANNYFGQQVLTDWNGFKVFGIQRPTLIDGWNLDLDYLSYRGLAGGTELGWSGRNLVGDLTDPYHKLKTGQPDDYPYSGYFDIWGLHDQSFFDTLGPGPAVVTNGPAGAGKRGYQRRQVPALPERAGPCSRATCST